MEERKAVAGNEWERELSPCMLCPRRCGADRLAGEKGVCGAAKALRAARAALHMWEEPCISGERGSGTVFFSGCALHCVYCQNEKIANGEYGTEISVERLAEIFLKLQEKGANNINLVTPGHYIPHIRRAIDIARADKMALPIVYNTGGYESAETIRSLEGYVDVYLPDLKYMDAALKAMKHIKSRRKKYGNSCNRSGSGSHCMPDYPQTGA